MISFLSGVVAEKDGQVAVIECAGVGYGVILSLNEYEKVPVGKPAKIYIYEHIREDAHDLYGFTSKEIKGLFEQLLSVKNVGPKVALSVLDIGSSSQVRMSIASGDVKKLQTAKGVGKRAAEQIIVELRDKVGVPVGEAAEDLVSRGGIDQSDEALQALTSLGYSEADAMTALAKIDKKLPTEERIKQALKGTR